MRTTINLVVLKTTDMQNDNLIKLIKSTSIDDLRLGLEILGNKSQEDIFSFFKIYGKKGRLIFNLPEGFDYFIQLYVKVKTTLTLTDFVIYRCQENIFVIRKNLYYFPTWNDFFLKFKEL